MEKMIMLGTGHATVTKCFNTCFAMKEGEEYFLVDAGGGNGILSQLEQADIPIKNIHHMFISHEHTDHILGAVWMIRMAAAKMKQGGYDGDLHIYCHDALADAIMTITRLTVQKKLCDYFENRIFFHRIVNDETISILKHQVTFFDICSDKAKQFGFMMLSEDGKKLTFLGDEYYRESEKKYALDSEWLLHEAFCLFRDREIFKPYEKFHATVKEACENAASLKAKNLILYHTEDTDLIHRKKNYSEEGKKYFKGNLYVPNDLEEIKL